MGDVHEELGKLSLSMSNGVGMTDPAIAEFVQVRQLAWAIRDSSGRECGTARPFVGRAKPFTPQARDTITDLRGRTDATLGQLTDYAARPGIAPELSPGVQTPRNVNANVNSDRETAYAKLDARDN